MQQPMYYYRKRSDEEQSKISKRKWKSTLIESQIERIKRSNTSIVQFKIASYNLLSPKLLEDNFYLYEHLDKSYLDWQYRRRNILKELKKLNAHIFCFQEMEEQEYESFFREKLLKMGYLSVYNKRGCQKVDGCCIAFKKNFFDLEKQINVNYFVPGVEILSKENIGIILLLKFKSAFSSCSNLHNEPKFLCVATTHILYNPKRGDSKMAQLQVLLANIDRIAFKKSLIIQNQLVTEYHPIILCGDFNFTNDSKIYEFLTEAHLENYKLLNRADLSGQKLDFKNYIPIGKCLIPERLGISDQSQFKPVIDSRNLRLLLDKNNLNQAIRASSFGTDIISHGFDFKSAYTHKDEKGAAEITTCIRDFRKSVDFIFFHSEDKSNFRRELGHESNKLHLLARLELFNENECKNLFIPNKNYSSDHFLVAAKFYLT